MLKVCGGSVSLYFLIIAHSVGFICVMMRLQHNKPLQPAKKPEQMHILLLSTWRSGSSFTGQIFSQHPDVFYLMEPAWHVWNTMPYQSVRTLQMAVRDLVRSVFFCDMSVFDAYIRLDKVKSNLFQWETSRALCSPPACHLFKRTDIIPQIKCRKLCNKYPFNTIQSSCKTYSHIMVKEVRFLDLKSLEPLIKDPSLNLKILHLVRDPRAVFRSREKAAGELSSDSDIILNDLPKNKSSHDKKNNPYKLIKRICQSQVDIYLSATNGSYGALDNRYMMMRYEDLVQSPIEKTRQMYEFGKLNFTPKMKNWVHNLTHGKGQGSSFVINSRDAITVSKAWRRSLQFKSVQKIQDLCAREMEAFGYKLLKSKKEQNDLNYELLLPIPKRKKTRVKRSDPGY